MPTGVGLKRSLANLHTRKAASMKEALDNKGDATEVMIDLKDAVELGVKSQRRAKGTPQPHNKMLTVKTDTFIELDEALKFGHSKSSNDRGLHHFGVGIKVLLATSGEDYDDAQLVIYTIRKTSAGYEMYVARMGSAIDKAYSNPDDDKGDISRVVARVEEVPDSDALEFAWPANEAGQRSQDGQVAELVMCSSHRTRHGQESGYGGSPWAEGGDLEINAENLLTPMQQLREELKNEADGASRTLFVYHTLPNDDTPPLPFLIKNLAGAEHLCRIEPNGELASLVDEMQKWYVNDQLLIAAAPAAAVPRPPMPKITIQGTVLDFTCNKWGKHMARAGDPYPVYLLKDLKDGTSQPKDGKVPIGYARSSWVVEPPPGGWSAKQSPYKPPRDQKGAHSTTCQRCEYYRSREIVASVPLASQIAIKAVPMACCSALKERSSSTNTPRSTGVASSSTAPMATCTSLSRRPPRTACMTSFLQAKAVP